MSDREKLLRIINEWNESRIDMFRMTEPDEGDEVLFSLCNMCRKTFKHVAFVDTRVLWRYAFLLQRARSKACDIMHSCEQRCDNNGRY